MEEIIKYLRTGESLMTENKLINFECKLTIHPNKQPTLQTVIEGTLP